MSLMANLTVGAYTALAAVLTFIAARAFGQSRSPRVAWIALAFVLLAAKGIVLSVGLFMRPSWEDLLLPALLLDMAVLVSFYVAVLRP